jgi:hypothetical protein
MCEWWPSCLRHCISSREVPRFVVYPGAVLKNFQVPRFLCLLLLALGFTRPLTEMSTKESNVRPALWADNSVVLLLPNVKVRMEVHHFIPL